MLRQQLAPVPAQDSSQHDQHQDRVVQLSGDGDEVGDQIERHRQVADEQAKQQLVPARYSWIAKEPREEDRAIRHEAGHCASVLPSSQQHEQPDERCVGRERSQRDEKDQGQAGDTPVGHGIPFLLY